MSESSFYDWLRLFDIHDEDRIPGYIVFSHIVSIIQYTSNALLLVAPPIISPPFR